MWDDIFRKLIRSNFLVEISTPENWGTPHNKTQGEIPKNRPVDISQLKQTINSKGEFPSWSSQYLNREMRTSLF